MQSSFEVILIPGGMKLPIAEDSISSFSISAIKSEVSLVSGVLEENVFLMNNIDGKNQPDLIESAQMLQAQPGGKIHVFCRILTPPELQEDELLSLPEDRRHVQEQIGAAMDSSPFCRLDSLGVQGLSCPEFASVIVYNKFSIREPEKVISWTNRAAQEYVQDNMNKPKVLRTRISACLPQFLPDLLLDRLEADELKVLNEGAQIRSYLDDVGNTDQNTVFLNCQLKIRILDEDHSPPIQDIRIDPMLYNIMRFAELKRIIATAIDRPFVLATSPKLGSAHGVQVDNMDFVKSSTRIPHPVMNDETGEYDWEVGVYVCFDQLTFMPNKEPLKNESLYFPKGMTIEDCHLSLPLDLLYARIAYFLESTPVAIFNSNLKVTEDTKREVDSFDLVLFVDKVIWIAFSAKPGDLVEVESNVPGISQDSSLGDAGLIKFGDLRYRFDAFQIYYIANDQTINKVVIFSKNKIIKMTYDQLANLIGENSPTGFFKSADILFQNLGAQITSSAWTDWKQSKGSVSRRIIMEQTSPYLGGIEVSESLISFESSRETRPSQRQLQEDVTLKIHLPLYAHFPGKQPSIMEFRARGGKTYGTLMGELAKKLEMPPGTFTLECPPLVCTKRKKKGVCFCKLWKQRQLTDVFNFPSFLASFADYGLCMLADYTRVCRQDGEIPFFKVQLEVCDRVLRLSLYNLKYLWFPSKAEMTLLDIKKKITNADFEVPNGSILKKEIPEEELFQHIRFLDLENVEVADATVVKSPELLTLAIEGSKSIIPMRLELRMGAFIDGKYNYRSKDDRQMLAMMTVVNRFREDTKDTTPGQKLDRLEQEAQEAFEESEHREHRETLLEIENQRRLSQAQINQANCMEELTVTGLFYYSLEGPSYTWQQYLRHHHFGSMKQFLSSIFNPEAIASLQATDSGRRKVYRGCSGEETGALALNEIEYSNVFLSSSKSPEHAQEFSEFNYCCDNHFYRLEIHLSNTNYPHTSLEVKKSRHDEKEELILPYFQYITIGATKQEIKPPDEYREVVPLYQQTHILLEVPFQNNLARLNKAKGLGIVWYDNYQNGSQLLEVLFPNIYKGVRNEDELFEALKEFEQVILILSGKLSFYFIRRMRHLKALENKITSVVIWTTYDKIEVQQAVLQELKHLNNVRKNVFATDDEIAAEVEAVRSLQATEHL